MNIKWMAPEGIKVLIPTHPLVFQLWCFRSHILEAHQKLHCCKMDLLDSLKWQIFSQQLYRLAVFRIDKRSRKIVTDMLEVFLSVSLVSVIVAEVGYISHKIYYSPAGNFFQINKGEQKSLLRNDLIVDHGTFHRR